MKLFQLLETQFETLSNSVLCSFGFQLLLINWGVPLSNINKNWNNNIDTEKDENIKWFENVAMHSTSAKVTSKKVKCDKEFSFCLIML